MSRQSILIRRPLAGVITTLTLALLISGCQSYRHGGSRTVGEFTDDVAIQTCVKSKLINDRLIKGMRINVDVRKGLVSLYGRVPSELLKTHATTLSEQCKGVTAVDNQLAITS